MTWGLVWGIVGTLLAIVVVAGLLYELSLILFPPADGDRDA